MNAEAPLGTAIRERAGLPQRARIRPGLLGYRSGWHHACNSTSLRAPISSPTARLPAGRPTDRARHCLGTVDLTDPNNPVSVPLRWTDNTGASTDAAVQMADGSTIQVKVTENPTVGDTEEWQIYNFTEDAHPIHLHLVRFEVLDRTAHGRHHAERPR